MLPVLTTNQMMSGIARDEDFAEWFVEDVMKQHIPDPYYAVSPEGLREMTVNGRDYARKCGITDFPSQAHFVILMWKIGANFWLQPGFREVAMNTAMLGPDKIDRFYAVPKDQAVHAIMNCNDTYWYPHLQEPIS
ncbi:MAG: hypothetical protein ACRCSU_03630 [Paracoccaceae bacterium]